MQEYVTDAIILRKEPFRDFDGRYYFFTKRFGKILGKAMSTRKITSKLAGHLEPGNLSQVRFVERNGTMVVDALKKQKLGATLLDLMLLNAMLSEGQPEPELWTELASDQFSWRKVLRILGWDPEGARCDVCGNAANYFSVARQEFFCAVCASKLPRKELLLVA